MPLDPKMMKKLALSIFTVIIRLRIVHPSVISLNETDSIKISLLPESEGPLLDADKPILRYGFHRTHDCLKFEKAFICVRKCLDLGYQIAHADKTCVCTCYRNSIIEKYKPPPVNGSEKWKLGAPSTVLPAWAGQFAEAKPPNFEINANYTEFVEDPNKTTGSDVAGTGTGSDLKLETGVTGADNASGNTTGVAGGTGGTGATGGTGGTGGSGATGTAAPGADTGGTTVAPA